MSQERKERKPARRPGGGGGHGRGGIPMQKPKDFRGTARRLMYYLQPHLWKLLIVCITAVLSTAFGILSPRVMGKAITAIHVGIRSGTPIDFAYIKYVLGWLGALYVLSAVFNYVQHITMVGVAQQTVLDMRQDINQKLSRLPLSFFDSYTHGEILSRVTNDVDTVSNTLQQSITQVIRSFITLVGTVVMMLIISPMLTLFCLITLPLYALVTKSITSRSRQYFKGQQEALGELNGHVEEMYTGHQIIKAFGREEASMAAFTGINDRHYEASWRAQFLSGIMMPLMNMISNLGYVFVAVVGGIYVMRGTMDLGDVQAFIQYSRQFTHPIIQTANIANVLQSTMAAAERVFELLDEPEEIPDAEPAQTLAEPQGRVVFRDVQFGYNPDKPLIANMNIDVQPGQSIAIVGPTGAGKTTLVNLLMRFYEIDGGSITVDGVDIRDMTRNHLRSIFGMVLQDTWLFNGTIRDNIAYGLAGATDEQVVQAAKAAHADHFIRTLPDGYDTVLNEDATNISQGQRQLLTIARAILADPAILILDEATSSVDTRTEIYIQKAMAKLMQGRTSFVIAHRLSTIRDADLILVMDQGSIVEQGTHAELLAANGFYADLYNSQFTSNGLVADKVQVAATQ